MRMRLGKVGTHKINIYVLGIIPCPVGGNDGDQSRGIYRPRLYDHYHNWQKCRRNLSVFQALLALPYSECDQSCAISTGQIRYQVVEFCVPVHMTLVIRVITNEEVIHGDRTDSNTRLSGLVCNNAQQTPEVATNTRVSHIRAYGCKSNYQPSRKPWWQARRLQAKISAKRHNIAKPCIPE
jgi:hypothetical protein